MKIAEVREIVEKYSEEQLKSIIAELYKAIPKAMKTEKSIDDILKEAGAKPKRKRQSAPPDLGEIDWEIREFIDNAYKQYYFIPNQFVSKKERPKWRFFVKRMYKALLAVSAHESTDEDDVILAAKLHYMSCFIFFFHSSKKSNFAKSMKMLWETG